MQQYGVSAPPDPREGSRCGAYAVIAPLRHLVSQRARAKQPRSLDGMQVPSYPVRLLIKKRQRLARTMEIQPVAGAARGNGNQCALEQALHINYRVILPGAQILPKNRDFVPDRSLPQRPSRADATLLRSSLPPTFSGLWRLPSPLYLLSPAFVSSWRSGYFGLCS